MSATFPDPEALVSRLVGHRVRLTLTSGAKREGTLFGCGTGGLQLLSGIGGQIHFRYGEIDAVDDLDKPTCICPRFSDTGGYRIADLGCPTHGINGTRPGDGPWEEGE